MAQSNAVRLVAGWMMLLVAAGFMVIGLLSVTAWRTDPAGWSVLTAVLLLLCAAIAALIAHMALRASAPSTAA